MEEEESMQIKRTLDDLRVKIDDKNDELSKRVGSARSMQISKILILPS